MKCKSFEWDGDTRYTPLMRAFGGLGPGFGLGAGVTGCCVILPSTYCHYPVPTTAVRSAPTRLDKEILLSPECFMHSFSLKH